MAIHNLNFTEKSIFQGNLCLVICCAFYLIWWLLAFHPTRAIKGIKTGWLLIPAFAAGLAAIILSVKGIQSAPAGKVFFPDGSLVWGGIAAYLILLLITRLLFKRPVTTELFLIIGWAVLALSEIDALYRIQAFSNQNAVLFTAIIGITALVSFVCYMLYFKLGTRSGYFDGMIPLILIALVMAGISFTVAKAG